MLRKGTDESPHPIQIEGQTRTGRSQLTETTTSSGTVHLVAGGQQILGVHLVGQQKSTSDAEPTVEPWLLTATGLAEHSCSEDVQGL